jgi:hypothetical protein
LRPKCEHKEKPTIVLCCDWQARKGTEERELVSADDVDKIREIIGVEASALLAGTETDADRLLITCESAIRKLYRSPIDSNTDLAVDTFLKELETAAETRKKEIIEHYIKMFLGLDYSSLRAIPKDRLTDIDEEAYHTFRTLNLGADVIIATDEAVIVRLDRWGRAHWENNYSVIGEGADIALAFLCQHQWDFGGSSEPASFGSVAPVTLMQCLYRVYEAKRAAEKKSSVGRSTALSVLIKGEGTFEVSDSCRQLLLEAFEQKNRVPQIRFDSSFLEASAGETKASESGESAVIKPQKHNSAKRTYARDAAPLPVKNDPE